MFVAVYLSKRHGSAKAIAIEEVEALKIGVVDVGGGYRGIYAAGVLDYCLDQKIRFDLGIGVSAGSANLLSFTAGQRGRNYRFYTEYGLRREYASPVNFVTKKTFIDLDYMGSTLSNSDGEYPIDYPAFRDNPMEFVAVATDALTGRTCYFDKSDITQDHYDVVKASCALPLVCHPYRFGGKPYFDGALGDPVPVQKAFDMGCDRVVVILTKPESEIRTSEKDEKLAQVLHYPYPLVSEELCKRADKYNRGVALAQEYARQGKAIIIAPDDTCGVRTLTRDKHLLDQLYKKGYSDGRKIKDFAAR